MRLAIFSKLFWLATTSAVLINCGGGNGDDGDQSNNSSVGDDADAVIADIPIAYIRRSLPLDEETGTLIANDALNPRQFIAGAQLFIRDRADANAAEINLSARVFGDDAQYDVKDLATNNDGSKLLFAMRAPELEDADEDEQPTWNIWQYDLTTDELNRIISDDITAEDGQDVSPAYLPDGRIVFSSNRQVRSKAILLDDGKPQYAALTDDRQEDGFVLHVMDEFGTNLQQITFNQSHDLQPTVLPNGLIVFNRWNRKGGNNRLSLFTTRPDGQDTQELYGYNSQNTGNDDSAAIFFDPRILADGRVLTILRPRESNNWGGDLMAIDYDNYSDIGQDIYLPISEEPGVAAATPGQESIAFADVIVDNDPTTIALNGYFSAATELYDDTPRLLVARTDCRLQDPASGDILGCVASNLAIEGITEADPLYGLWIYNLQNLTLQPLFAPTPGYMYTDVVSFGVRPENTFLADRQGGVELNQDLVNEGAAVLHIRNVYEVAGESEIDVTALADPALFSADERPARFIKIEKPVSQPSQEVLDFSNAAFGYTNVMREIMGYAPVEPDGSVKTLIPTDVALTLSLTNAAGQRVSGTTSVWFSARPGQTIESHDLNVGLRRLDETQASTNPGAPMDGYNFPNTEPLLIARTGETMAETWARINGIRRLSVDLIYQDEWTNPTVRAKDPSFAYQYANLQTPAPVSDVCQSQWRSECRVTINYPDHIQPIWDLNRQELDDVGNVIVDNTCTLCHNTQNENGGAQVPAGQLELTQSPLDTNNRYRSFLDVGAGDVELELNEDGVLVPRLELLLDGNGNPIPVRDGDGNVIYQTDADGNILLDANGNPVPEYQTTSVGNPGPLTPGAAVASPEFFDRFAEGGSHAGRLSQDELKLIAEWLDLGAQYYNNPFAAPLN
ncbi:hypothetical protein [Halioxenophilus aromaticivorans]|uniref:Cytochrome c domain-containing protein n=1 Tax=Halioxenophilus aromaticivorans TaxID=1306992 RepID=A0AAV3U2A9_9ALTE